MGQRTKRLTDLDEVQAAFRCAAHNAVHGTREQRSGRFLRPQPDWDRWDEQIAKDVEDGKLDKLLEEAKRHYERGDCEEL